MVFIIGVLLAQSFIAPAAGGRSNRRRLRKRITNLATEQQAAKPISLVRERFLKEMSPLERSLMKFPAMESLQTLAEQSGSNKKPRQILMESLIAAVVGGIGAFMLGYGHASLIALVLASALPVFMLMRQRSKRLTRFEEQYPDALTTMARALRAGLPFTQALLLVSREMPDPIGVEFGIVYTEINYGGDTRSAMLDLAERVPSVAVSAMITTVLIQRETGGNLAEVLDKLANLMRERFKFQRTLKTLSAEGRLAGWILSLLPFVLAGVITLISPEFLEMLTEDPAGRKLILIAFVLIIIGILWLRKIVRVDI